MILGIYVGLDEISLIYSSGVGIVYESLIIAICGLLLWHWPGLSTIIDLSARACVICKIVHESLICVGLH